MSSNDYLPRTDAGLLAFSAQMSTKLTATPTVYGVTAAMATVLSGLQSAYATALAAATDPHTRGVSTVYAKSQARANLVAEIRTLARLIQGTPTVTNQQRVDLGLPVRKTEPTPIPPPAVAPDLDVTAVVGRTVKCRVHDGGPLVRRKPAGAQGVFIYTHVGPTQPADLNGWDLRGSATRNTFEVTFDSTVPGGALVWLTCSWFNPRTQTGPAATPVSVYLQGAAATAGA